MTKYEKNLKTGLIGKVVRSAEYAGVWKVLYLVPENAPDHLKGKCVLGRGDDYIYADPAYLEEHRPKDAGLRRPSSN